MAKASQEKSRQKFPGVFWLVIIFEFFERGSYYGMMSVLSVYFTDYLFFSKESVGIIKSVIQPILYFLPIVAGALADRFGYRKALTVAFILMGGGYFLTSQSTEYTTVFLALVVMALGAGTFKPIISGTIARTTDESNSTLGFGIYYWSINLGAFLFPLFLVPWLKSISWPWVIIAAAMGTGAMLIPTLLFFREPVVDKSGDETAAEEKPSENLVQTLANAFEIIYSPFILLYRLMRSPSPLRLVVMLLSALFLVFAVNDYLQRPEQVVRISAVPVTLEGVPYLVQIDRDQSAAEAYDFQRPQTDLPFLILTEFAKKEPDLAEVATYLKTVIGGFSDTDELDEDWLRGVCAEVRRLLWAQVPERGGPFLARLTIHQPEKFADAIAAELDYYMERDEKQAVARFLDEAEERLSVGLRRSPAPDRTIPQLAGTGPEYHVMIPLDLLARLDHQAVLRVLLQEPKLAGLDEDDLVQAMQRVDQRSFLWLFVALLYFTSLTILALQGRIQAVASAGVRSLLILAFAAAMMLVIWLLPDLSLFARILSSVIYLTLLSLFIMDVRDLGRFRDHFKFLLMIFLYSGFWVLYFQMFDSVLWYVKAYVDASPLNDFINGLLHGLGISYTWRFDVEHVTVINAFTIIVLQLVISYIVRRTKALPTMTFGILLGTVGMAVLAISTHIWVFLLGIIVFSIGEMTAHPKFISYVGLAAPQARKALYMGYIFLYGVIGSGIGGVVGANLYVHFVDHLNQPDVLWLIFAGIGLVTIFGLLLFNRFAAVDTDKPVGDNGG